jgi:hypothetical protein
MSARSQRIILWWSLIFLTVYGLSLMFLLHMLPPPSATWTAARVAQFYADHSFRVKLGATLCSWTSGFMVPMSVVIAVQVLRHERGRPIWSVLAVAGGSLMSIFIVLPQIFWGVAAFTPTRSPEITATLHELGVITFITTDQYYIFLWVAVAVISLLPNAVEHSPFPRWFGYFTAWLAVTFETGAVAFLFRSGPFSWNGLFTFWIPLPLFGVWTIVLAILLFKAITAQETDSAEALVETGAQ